MTWAALTEDFLQQHSGEKFTIYQLAEFYQQFSAYDYSPETIRGIANKQLRKMKKDGKVLQEGWTFGPDRRSHYIIWRALR